MKTLIIVTDKNGGISFNNRRLCWNKNIKVWLLNLAKLAPLTAEISAKAYLGTDAPITYVEDLTWSILRRGEGNLFFFADKTVEPAMFLNCDRVIIFTLDRVYPSDKKLEIPTDKLSLKCIFEGDAEILGYTQKEYEIKLLQSYRDEQYERCLNLLKAIFGDKRPHQS